MFSCFFFFGKYYLSIFFLRSGHCIAPCSPLNVTAILWTFRTHHNRRIFKKETTTTTDLFFLFVRSWCKVENDSAFPLRGEKANVLLIRNGTRTRNFSPLNGFCHDLRYSKSNETNERNKLSLRQHRIRKKIYKSLVRGKFPLEKKISSRWNERIRWIGRNIWFF